MTVLEKYPPGVALNGGFTREHPFKDRDDVEYMSYSRLSKFRTSPLSYKRAYIDGIKPDKSTSMDVGTAIHYALLERERFNKLYVVKPKFAGTGARTREKEWVQKQCDDAVIVTSNTADKIEETLSFLEESPFIKDTLKNGVAEVYGHAWDDELGVMWLCKFDYVRSDKDVIIELKTTSSSVDPEKWQWSTRDFAYHIQAWIYHRVYRLITGQAPNFFMCVCELVNPWGVVPYTLSQSEYQGTTSEIRFLLDHFSICKSQNTWPRLLGHTVKMLQLPMTEKYRMEALMEETEESNV